MKGEMAISWCTEGYRMPEVVVSIQGSKGIIKVNDDNVYLQVDSGASSWFRHDLADNVPFWLGSPEYYREDEHFFKSVLTKESAKPDFEAASKVDKLIEEIQQEAQRSD